MIAPVILGIKILSGIIGVILFFWLNWMCCKFVIKIIKKVIKKKKVEV